MLSPPEVEYPVLLVSGDRDEYSDPELVRRAAAAIGPNAEAAVLPGVGHFWAGSDERLREAVVGFLRKHVV
jgi:pimeloyl-ACP methyl ester carboxylesterase